MTVSLDSLISTSYKQIYLLVLYLAHRVDSVRLLHHENVIVFTFLSLITSFNKLRHIVTCLEYSLSYSRLNANLIESYMILEKYKILWLIEREREWISSYFICNRVHVKKKDVKAYPEPWCTITAAKSYRWLFEAPNFVPLMPRTVNADISSDFIGKSTCVSTFER